ncbi:hypothetical protein FRC03_009009 [Tulasnella sp. 419]|nr:hypothetical protein FRC03_009009 [Tulasnella sp. 419]
MLISQGQLNGDQPSPSNTRSGLPRARHRSLPIHVPESNVVMNSNESIAGRHNILFEGTQPAFYIGAGPMLVPYRYPPHQYYEEGQTYYIPMSGPSTSPPAGPSQVRGHGVSSPGYYGTYHPAGSMTRNWVPIGNPIDPQADLTGPSGHANPRPAYAEPAYIEYAGASRSSYRAMTIGATSHGSMSEGSVVVYGMNNSSGAGPNPPLLQTQILAPNEPFSRDNGGWGNQTVDHDENRKPCKGHGFRHWLRTHFGRHKCRKNLKDVLVITPYIS